MEISVTELLTTLATQSFVAELALGLTVGLLLGFIHFGSLWWTVQLFAGGNAARALAAQLLRFALLGAALFALAKLGAVALLASALGLLLARALLLRRFGRIT